MCFNIIKREENIRKVFSAGFLFAICDHSGRFEINKKLPILQNILELFVYTQKTVQNV